MLTEKHTPGPTSELPKGRFIQTFFNVSHIFSAIISQQNCRLRYVTSQCDISLSVLVKIRSSDISFHHSPGQPVIVTRHSESQIRFDLFLSCVLVYTEKYCSLCAMRHGGIGPATRVRFPAWVTVCVEFARSPRVCVGFLRVLQFPPTV